MTKANKQKRKTLLDQVRGWYVLIYISLNLYKYSSSWFQNSFYFLFFYFFYDPFCSRILSFLYSLPFFHLSLPRVDQIAYLLDICPINTFLKFLWVAVRLEVTIQVSLPHKCSQLVRCKAFNVVVAVFFFDTSQFYVDSPLSETYPPKHGCPLPNT